MSEGKKTFRLGGAGGYSVRAEGYAPQRFGQPRSYHTIELWCDDKPERLNYVNLPTTPPQMKALMSVINDVKISGDDKLYLWSLVMEAWKLRVMG